MNLDWKIVVLASVVFVTVGALTFVGKLPAQVITVLASGALGWLVPSPVTRPSSTVTEIK